MKYYLFEKNYRLVDEIEECSDEEYYVVINGKHYYTQIYLQRADDITYDSLEEAASAADKLNTSFGYDFITLHGVIASDEEPAEEICIGEYALVHGLDCED